MNYLDINSFLSQNQSLREDSNTTQKSHYETQLSFDTISFVIPVPLESRDEFKKSFDLRRFYWGKDKDREFNSCKFSLSTNSEFYRQKSYSDEILFNETSEGFKFQLSAPKFLFGHNCFLVWDLRWFLEYFKEFIEDATKLSMCSIDNWLLKRIDVCCNFLLRDLSEVRSTLSFLSNYKFRNKNNQRNKGKDIAYWTYNRRTLKFYSKHDEMIAHKKYFSVDEEYFNKLIKFSKNILRFEEEWRLNELRYRTGQKAAFLTVKCFLDYLESSKFNLFGHIESITGDLKRNSVLSSIDSCVELIEVVLGKKKANLIRFLNIFFTLGNSYLRESYSKATYYRYKKELKHIGIDIDKISLDELEEEVSFSFKDKVLITNFDNSEAFALDLYFKRKIRSLLKKPLIKDLKLLWNLYKKEKNKENKCNLRLKIREIINKIRKIE